MPKMNSNFVYLFLVLLLKSVSLCLQECEFGLNRFLESNEIGLRFDGRLEVSEHSK